MTRPRVIVVGLGPAGGELMTHETALLIREAPRVLFRTSRHPAAEKFDDIESFDHLYERFETFDEVYRAIVQDVVRQAREFGEVVYVVPGSPMVAERTVELLMAETDLDLDIRPALSFADLAWIRLGVDPMANQARFADGTAIEERLRGPGPLLVTQCHSTAVLSQLKLSIDTDMQDPAPRAVILHHLGLDDEEVIEMEIDEIDRFDRTDHLTSCYLPMFRTVGVAAEDLFDLMTKLRAECPWDQKQTHESLTRHLLEESYELLEALEHLTATIDEGTELDDAYAHVQEELGDVVFQVVFHAQLALEDGRFDLTDVFDGVRTKLIARHPHVFGDVVVSDTDDVETNWEAIKRAEKGRGSVIEGIPLALPALARYAKLRKKALAIEMASPTLESLRQDLVTLVGELERPRPGEPAQLVGLLLQTGVELAQHFGVDSEAVLRQRAEMLSVQIIETEQIP